MSPNRSPRLRARLRACCTVHSPVGLEVTPPRCIRRVLCSMNTTYRRRRCTVSTWKKSAARIVLACGEARPAAAVLVDTQVGHRGDGLLQQRIRRGGEHVVHHGQETPACRGLLRRDDPPPGDLVRGLLPQPVVIRHRGGSCGTHSVNVLRGHS